MRTLRITSGPAAGQEMAIENELIVGREDADLVIFDEEISRRHAVLRPVDGGVEVEDLGSTNGTFVDGSRISEPVTIAIRGAVKLGLSEIRVDVSLPQETTIGPVGQATSVRDFTPAFDVTAPRDVPAFDPDVTAPRKVPSIDPDVTAPRKVPSIDPDVTAPRRVPEPAQAAPAAGATDRSPSRKPPLAALAVLIVLLLVVVTVLVLLG